MNCYQHRENVALGVCAVCQKGVCSTCVKDVGLGIVCSEECLNEFNFNQAIKERGRQFYKHGGISKAMLNIGYFAAFMGVVMLGSGIYPLLKGNHVEWFSIILGAGFVIFSLFNFIYASKNKSKKSL